MALQPVARRSVPDEVFDQILSDVVSGEFAPGESLPSERKLAEVLGVSRPAVREALQRVAQAGLVEVRQGDSTTVRDYRRHASLDLLPRLLLPHGELDPSVARSILEARLLIGPKVAALAAERAGAGSAPTCASRWPRSRPTRTRWPASGTRSCSGTTWSTAPTPSSSGSCSTVSAPRTSRRSRALATLMETEVSRVEVYRTLTDAIVAGEPDARPPRRAGPARAGHRGVVDGDSAAGGDAVRELANEPTSQGASTGWPASRSVRTSRRSPGPAAGRSGSASRRARSCGIRRRG